MAYPYPALTWTLSQGVRTLHTHEIGDKMQDTTPISRGMERRDSGPSVHKLLMPDFESYVELHGELLCDDGQCELYRTNSGRVLMYDGATCKVFGFDEQETHPAITVAKMEDCADSEVYIDLKEALGHKTVVGVVD
jgi:hypothetical protein